jgi:hypothetical protein
MKINSQMIVNNFEWIVNNQIAMDIIKLLGFITQFNDVYKEIRKLAKAHKNNNDIFDNEDITMEYITTNKNKVLPEFLGIFDLFYELNSKQKNKNTYLPNLFGILLISQS